MINMLDSGIRRINSYIVGCKYILPTFPFVCVGWINSYIVGCKSHLILMVMM